MKKGKTWAYILDYRIYSNIGATLNLGALWEACAIFSVLLGGAFAICNYFFSGAYIRKYTVHNYLDTILACASATKTTCNKQASYIDTRQPFLVCNQLLWLIITCHRIHRYASDFTPLLSGCSCYTCTHHTKAYIHHLLAVKEILATVLLMK